jgi:uncharacterized protein YigA (DUF484 family)
MTDTPSALTVARFLQDNPAFFTEHAELFSALTVPHPNQSRAISLGERQIMTLRERLKDLEQRLATLSYQAVSNQALAQKLNLWCADLLAVSKPSALPDHIETGLKRIFDIPEVALRLWGFEDKPDLAEPSESDARAFAQGLTAPYCGPNKDFGVARWLPSAPASLAIVPLKHAHDPGADPFGLLLLGSNDLERFSPDMGTAFLETIGELVSAALTRLPQSMGDEGADRADTADTP